MRIDYGPGYRVYYARWRGEAVVLLTGGTKAGQPADVRAAQRLAAQLREDCR